MVKSKFEFGLSNGFCTMGGAISGEKKELSCQVTRNMGKLPLYHDKCHILQQCHKIIVTHNNNMNNNKIVCPHCGKNNFKCSRGLTQHLTNAAYCSQAEKEKRDKEDGYFTAPETITFGDNYWQMHHDKLAKRAKQTDDRRLARRKQIKELAKYVSKEFSASGTKLGVGMDVNLKSWWNEKKAHPDKSLKLCDFATYRRNNPGKGDHPKPCEVC
jgi:hypothetical protein